MAISTIPGAPDLGQNGSQVIADTNATTGDWFCIDVLVACVFTTLTGNLTPGATSFPAGTKIFGRFTAITLASGTIIAYKA